jgi:hypothetical protein
LEPQQDVFSTMQNIVLRYQRKNTVIPAAAPRGNTAIQHKFYQDGGRFDKKLRESAVY